MSIMTNLKQITDQIHEDYDIFCEDMEVLLMNGADPEMIEERIIEADNIRWNRICEVTYDR